jgi:hypothetical protein
MLSLLKQISYTSPAFVRFDFRWVIEGVIIEEIFFLLLLIFIYWDDLQFSDCHF